MPENCISCRKPKIVLPWNTNVDVLVCDNSRCGFYRQPSPVPKGGTPTLKSDLGDLYAKQKRRPKVRKYAAFTFEEKLQELRDGLST